MRYKNFLFTGIGFVLAVFYVLYKRSPTIQQALIADGYKLISSSEKKQEIYSNILKRNEKDIDLIVLDPYLISENRRWEALSFWCDWETNKISFLRNLNVYKKFCIMDISDVATDKNLNYLAESKENYDSLLLKKQEDFRNWFGKNKEIETVGVRQFWKNWCDSNSIQSFWKINFWLSENVFKYCYIESD